MFKDVLNTYCWIHSTYTIPRYLLHLSNIMWVRLMQHNTCKMKYKTFLCNSHHHQITLKLPVPQYSTLNRIFILIYTLFHNCPWCFSSCKNTHVIVVKILKLWNGRDDVMTSFNVPHRLYLHPVHCTHKYCNTNWTALYRIVRHNWLQYQ